MPTRSPTLRLLQALAVTVLLRDSVGACQGLRMISQECDDREGEFILRQLCRNLTPQERFWLGSLHGARVGLQQPEAA
jgi:hypothetical protein